MKKMKIIIYFSIFLLLSAVGTAGSILSKGEYLEYEVSYFGIKLGTIKTIVAGFEKVNEFPVTKINAQADSYAGIPFVDLHVKMTTYIDEPGFYSHLYKETRKVENDIWDYQKIMYDYKLGLITSETWRQKKQIEKVTLNTSRKCQDGLSLLFYARQFANQKKKISVFTSVFSDTCWTMFNFYNKKESVSIDAVQYPVESIYFEGQAFWKGIYGLSGKFKGWVSNDNARIPILAKMSLYVGSVKIELKSWKRAGWKPPKSAN